MLLFKIERTFLLKDKGLILHPGVENPRVNIGSIVRLIRPDKTILEAIVKGIVYNNNDILIDDSIQETDIPIGTEVWLME